MRDVVFVKKGLLMLTGFSDAVYNAMLAADRDKSLPLLYSVYIEVHNGFVYATDRYRLVRARFTSVPETPASFTLQLPDARDLVTRGDPKSISYDAQKQTARFSFEDDTEVIYATDVAGPYPRVQSLLPEDTALPSLSGGVVTYTPKFLAAVGRFKTQKNSSVQAQFYETKATVFLLEDRQGQRLEYLLIPHLKKS